MYQRAELVLPLAPPAPVLPSPAGLVQQTAQLVNPSNFIEEVVPALLPFHLLRLPKRRILAKQLHVVITHLGGERALRLQANRSWPRHATAGRRARGCPERIVAVAKQGRGRRRPLLRPLTHSGPASSRTPHASKPSSVDPGRWQPPERTEGRWRVPAFCGDGRHPTDEDNSPAPRFVGCASPVPVPGT